MLKTLLNRLSGAGELSYVNVGAEDFITLYQGLEDAKLLDVRTPTEVAQDRISENQDHIDMFDQDFMDHLSNLDKRTPYFVYCRSGNRSKTVAKAMSDLGFQSVYHLSGGLIGFRSILGNRRI